MERGGSGAITWPFVGREQVVAEVLDAARAGRAGCVLVGPAGCGRTAVLAAVAPALEELGRPVAWIRPSHVDDTEPFGALAPLLEGPIPEGADAFRWVLAHVAGRAKAVVVDDAHLLDPSSAAVVEQLAAIAGTFLVVATAGGLDGPRWTERGLRRLDLLPLDERACGDLLEAALGGPLDGRTRTELVERSGAVLALLRPLAEAGLVQGALRREDGVWRAVRPIAITPELADLVAQRLGGAGSGARRALELLAVAGALRLEVATALVDGAVLEQLEVDGFVVAETDQRRRTRLRAAIPLVAEVVAEGLPVLRRRRLVGEVADALDELVDAGDAGGRDRVQAALLALEVGRALDAAPALSAAQEAWRSFDARGAEALARAAVAGGAGFEAELLVARAVAQTDGPEPADEHFAAAVAGATTDAERVAGVVARSEHLLFFCDRPDDAIGAIEAVEAVVTDAEGLVALAAKRGLLLHSVGRSVEALELLEPILDQLRGDTLSLACFAVATGATATGRASAALAACDLAEAAAALEPSTGGDPMLVELSRCAALGLTGELGDALELTKRHYDDAVADGARHRQAWFAWARGGLLLTMGHVSAAIRWCGEARSLLRDLGQLPAERLVVNDLARALALAGRPDEAEAVVAEVERSSGAELFDDDAVQLVSRGWIDASRGDLRTARARFTEAAQRFAAKLHAYPELHALVDIARCGAPGEVLPRVRELAEVVEGSLAEAQAAFVGALAGTSTAAALDAADRFEAIGCDLFAAEAAAVAADRFERRNDARMASAAARRSAELVGRCGDPRTPLLRVRDDAPALSARERQVAGLAAFGRSNRDIAEDLVLSVRTVETHLQRAYQKLGITRREQLAEALDADPRPRSTP